MLKFEDLVIQELDKITEDSLETTRIGLDMSREQFTKLLDTEDGEIFRILDDRLTETVIKRVDENYLDHQTAVFQQSQRTILNEHRELFHYYFLFVHSAFNVFEKLKVVVDKKKLDIGDVTLICLMGNLSRMADEIGNSLSNGSTRSALAQWRSFYEHVVVGVFLMRENSPELFKKFADFSHRDIRKQKESFDLHRELLKFPPLTEQMASRIDDRTDELKNTYGKDFFDDYAWAKDALKEKGRPDFRKVEAQAGMSLYRPFYIWASNFTHPNFRSVTGIEVETAKINLAKIIRQNMDKESFIDPMQCTLITFYIFLDHFLHRYSVDHQYSTNLLIFRKLIDRLQKKF